ncbi:MAG: hypothetical protein Q8O67_16635 [Deltaproteobacteria bacterium]|nr:hypothetical protein [Deltaproteobacteria bacterium]
MTGPLTPQSLSALLDEEQRRHDAWLQTIRGLVDASRGLKLTAPSKADDDDDAARIGVLGSLKRRLRARKPKAQVSKRSVEDALRGRIESALGETKKASLLVDRFAALRDGLFADLERLHQHVANTNAFDTAAGAAVIDARVAEQDAALSERERDAARQRRHRFEQQQELAHRALERLAVLVASARGLLDVTETLSVDVAAFARAAERQLDGLSARARALGVVEDAASVVEELERSLLTLAGSLDDVTVFATAVHERVTAQTSSTGLAQALDTLVQGALARRAANSAREQAAS